MTEHNNDYRKKVRASVERVRGQNREILDRMAKYDSAEAHAPSPLLRPDDVFLCCFNRVRDGHSPDCLRTSELQRANRLAMAIKRAKGCCEARFKLSEYATTRCMRGVGLGPFYTTDGRVRMLCDECWEEAVDIQQWNVAHRLRLTP